MAPAAGAARKKPEPQRADQQGYRARRSAAARSRRQTAPRTGRAKWPRARSCSTRCSAGRRARFFRRDRDADAPCGRRAGGSPAPPAPPRRRSPRRQENLEPQRPPTAGRRAPGRRWSRPGTRWWTWRSRAEKSVVDDFRQQRGIGRAGKGARRPQREQRRIERPDRRACRGDQKDRQRGAGLPERGKRRDLAAVKRSEAGPLQCSSASSGRNCASPTKPRLSALPVVE